MSTLEHAAPHDRATAPSVLRRVLLAAAVVTLVACQPDPTDTSDTADTSDTSDTAPVPPATPVVTVTGATIFLEVGQTVQLQASTTDGEDATYAWSSTDAGVATVSADGVVTGVSLGEVAIAATGSDTEAVGEIGLYVSSEIPFLDAWSSSAHADHDSQAFRNWDGAGAVPTSCARCHSGTGFVDYLADEVVDDPAPPGDVIACMTCHDPAASALSTVVFPSGVRLDGLGPEAICMTCHQGRASGASVDNQIAGIDPIPADDEVSGDIRFTNIHFYAAGATLNAGVAGGGYQYASLADGSEPAYDVRFRHVPGFDTCVGCHDPHSLELRLPLCADCHDGVTTKEDLRDIRMASSLTTDYDGDGDLTEGLYHELHGVRAKLLDAIRAYADQTTGTDPICYDSARHPYFFHDEDGDGACGSAETTAYATFTPRLARAAYNYQVGSKDPGAYAHNAKYIIALMHDSIRDLNHGLGTPVAFAGERDDPGHFDGTGTAFRRWDASESISASCSRCHGGSEGFHFYTTFGVSIAVLDKPNGLDCVTCHDEAWFKGESDDPFYAVASVTFPSTITKAASTFAAPSDALCATCHSGRRSKRDVDNASSPGNSNMHYLPAAATWYGTEVKVGYEYDEKDYDGGWTHVNAAANSCSFCHSAEGSQHTFRVADLWETSCTTGCHVTQTLAGAREPFSSTPRDYDGDGDTTEPLADELARFMSQLILAMDSHSQDNAGPRLCFDTAFRVGVPDAHGACTSTSGNFNAWSHPLMRASHNFNMARNDRGAWAHNMPYITQLLYDSIEALDPAFLSYDDGDSTVSLQRLSRE